MLHSRTRVPGILPFYDCHRPTARFKRFASQTSLRGTPILFSSLFTRIFGTPIAALTSSQLCQRPPPPRKQIRGESFWIQLEDSIASMTFLHKGQNELALSFVSRGQRQTVRGSCNPETRPIIEFLQEHLRDRDRLNAGEHERFRVPVFFTNVFAPHEDRGARDKARPGRAPQGCRVRKDRPNYASKRSGSKAFSRRTEPAVGKSHPSAVSLTLSYACYLSPS